MPTRSRNDRAGHRHAGKQLIDRDLTVSTPQGYNWAVQDELQNSYHACTSRP